jgi:hypothetical protein
MHPDKAFLHITIVSESGFKYSTCEIISVEKAKEIAWEFNVKIN